MVSPTALVHRYTSLRRFGTVEPFQTDVKLPHKPCSLCDIWFEDRWLEEVWKDHTLW